MMTELTPARGQLGETPIVLSRLPELPLVSVLIANYNYGHYVGKAIESVLGQTYQHVEIVICDDGSVDESREVIGRYQARDHRVRLVSKPNGGMASAYNAAFRESRGDIICLLDADDTFVEQKLERVAQHFVAHPTCGYLHHPVTVVDHCSRDVQQVPFGVKLEEGWLADRVVRRGGRWRWMPTSAISFRRELAEYLFPIPEATLTWTADEFIAIVAALLTNVAALGDPLTRYRIHGRNSMGAMGRNIATTRRALESTAIQVDAANARLAELGFGEAYIDVSRNLLKRQNQFMLALFEGKHRLGLVHELAALIPAMLTDDLYSRPQKLVAPVIYGGAVLLPTAARSWWLTQTLGVTKTKQRLGQAAGRLRQAQRALLGTRSLHNRPVQW